MMWINFALINQNTSFCANQRSCTIHPLIADPSLGQLIAFDRICILFHATHICWYPCGWAQFIRANQILIHLWNFLWPILHAVPCGRTPRILDDESSSGLWIQITKRSRVNTKFVIITNKKPWMKEICELRLHEFSFFKNKYMAWPPEKYGFPWSVNLPLLSYDFVM